VVRRTGLGKGLGALIPADGGDEDAILRDLPLSSIEANPYQPRKHFGEESLVELAASIREVGVLQPIIVRPLDEGRFELVAGERRWRAARRAGLTSIPAIVREGDDSTSVEHALIENLHREDLNALEEAAAYQQLIEEFGLTHDDVATRVGKSRSAVSNTLRLLQLPLGVQHLVVTRQLSAGHARAIMGTPDRSDQELLARRAVDEGLSVRAVEELVRAMTAVPTDEADDGGEAAERPEPVPGPLPRAPLRPPGLLELEDLLSTYLDTRVQVAMGGRRGKVTIEFADLEDLERIYRVMTEPRTP
jgi:ParB family chromosome partitioning protein